MIRHLVLIKFKPGTPEARKEELVANLEALFSKIKEIQAFERGTNCSIEPLDQGFTHIFFMTFKDEADRTTYIEHAEHQKFVKENLDHVESAIALDWDNKQALAR